MQELISLAHHRFILTGLPKLGHDQGNENEIESTFSIGIFLCKTRPVSIDVTLDNSSPEYFFSVAINELFF